MGQKPAFQSIIFPVDFSGESDFTAPYVREFALLTGAKLTLLHVVPWLSGWYGVTELRPPVIGDEELRDICKRQIKHLEKFRERHFSQLPCFLYVKDGAVAETIADTAQEIRADLIMMPTHGHGPSRRFLIGSIAAKVLHDASCAVWTSPHVDHLQPFIGFRHLLCAIDRSEVQVEFLREVTRIASCFRSQLSFVAAIEGTADPAGGKKRQILTLDKASYQDGLFGELGGELDSTIYVGSGPIGELVRRLALDQNADLVVTNRGHLQHRFGKLRTHAYEIVLESPCPVLSLAMTARQTDEAGEYSALQRV